MISLSPAYGRDYKSKSAVLADLNNRKDFIFHDITSQWDGKPCTPSDLGVTSMIVRYDRKLKQMVAKFVNGIWK